ncbi:MAG: bifunctional methylenetetrahydrofolate dehydrogenase/methenyltetrahydrofolate cyclohydrolase FolD [Nitrospinaceae bacterium]
MTLIDGKAVAREVKDRVAAEVARLRDAAGRVPGLAVVQVGGDPASSVYVRNKNRTCEQIGFNSFSRHLPADIPQTGLLAVVEEMNEDPAIHGILVQLPLPDHIETGRVLEAIDPAKDVDGFHPINVGRLTAGRPGLIPCTPAGIIELLDHYRIPIEGQDAVVLGRSNIVGKPMALLLLQRHATVTICHSRTRDLAATASRADIVIAAVGRPRFVTADMVKPGAVVIDVGINRVDGKLVGDVDHAPVAAKASYITPVPGGVGPMTIAMLMQNTLTAFQRSLAG